MYDLQHTKAKKAWSLVLLGSLLMGFFVCNFALRLDAQTIGFTPTPTLTPIGSGTLPTVQPTPLCWVMPDVPCDELPPRPDDEFTPTPSGSGTLPGTGTLPERETNLKIYLPIIRK